LTGGGRTVRVARRGLARLNRGGGRIIGDARARPGIPRRHVRETAPAPGLVPRGLTEGRSAVRVRVKFTPVKWPLFPGRPLPDLAWGEIRYTAYCFVMPEAAVKPR
jgi:hypothetical protein